MPNLPALGIYLIKSGTAIKMLLTSTDLEILLEHSNSDDREDRYITDRVSWQQYEALLETLDERSNYQVYYLDGVLEIVSPSRRHEQRKTRIGT
jgi:Uma2 family endonuclease